jgi:hypothetical protein
VFGKLPPTPETTKQLGRIKLINHTFMQNKYAWVNFKDGYTVYRSTEDPKDEILVMGKEQKPLKIKEIWNGKVKEHWDNKKIKKIKWQAEF